MLWNCQRKKADYKWKAGKTHSLFCAIRLFIGMWWIKGTVLVIASQECSYSAYPLAVYQYGGEFLEVVLTYILVLCMMKRKANALLPNIFS